MDEEESRLSTIENIVSLIRNHIIVIQLEDAEIKYEPLSSDDEFAFQFEMDDRDYDGILHDLKAKDSDLEEVNSDVKINCPQEDCTRSFTRRHNLIKHIKSHEFGLDRPGSICKHIGTWKEYNNKSHFHKFQATFAESSLKGFTPCT